MLETASIDQAYDDLVKNLFAVFFRNYTDAMGESGAEADAEARFRGAIVHARYVRDRAKAVLP